MTTKGRVPKDFVPDYAGDIGADFELWLEDVNDYLAICNVSTAADKKRLFLNLAGLSVRKVVKGLVIPSPPANDDGSPGDEYVALTDAVLAHFRPTINTTSERHKFRQLKQGPEESVSTFVGRLRERVDLCKFGATDVDSVVNSQVRDQLVAGLKSPEVRRELLKESRLTLADAITKAVALETSYAESKLYDPPAEPANQFSSVAAVSATRQQRRQPRTVSGSCKYCGRTHAKGKSFCPAANIRCRSCSKVGHFAAVCQSQRSGLDANAVDEEPADLADQAHLVYDTVYMAEQTGSHRQFLASLLVDGKECEGLLDTGASRTILTDDIVQPTRSSNRVLKAYTGGEIATLGMADVTIASPTRTMSCSCFVVPHGKHRILFGQDVISELELLVPAHLVDTGNLVDTAPISISVDAEARPVAQPARRPPFSAKADIEHELHRLVKADIIEPVKEASGWVSPIVPVHDVLVYGRNRAEHDARLASVLERLKAANLCLNWGKCRTRLTCVKYLGHVLTKQGVQPDTCKLQAISELSEPTCLADVQRFLGMVTYLGKFVPQLSQVTEPLRSIVKQPEPFVATESLIAAFNAVKQAVASSLQTLAYFRPSPDVRTAVSCDASPQGLGAILWQHDDKGQWVPVTCASRSLTDVETRYSQMEREMLGVVFALTRFRQYVLGRDVDVFTDHRPLLHIVQKPFDDVPPRLQRWLVSLMPYSYSLKHIPGKQLLCVDALSRAPLKTTVSSPAESRSLNEYVNMVLEAAPVNLEEIRRATQDDATLHSVLQRVLTSSWRDASPAEQPYYLVRDQLTAADGVLLLSARVVIPEGLRHSVMALAHEGHPGQEAFQDSLRQRVWWPGLTKDASLYVERCSECWRRRTNSPQDLLPTEIEGVWEKLAIDLVSIEGHSVLSLIDYGSRYPILKVLSSTTTTAIVDELDEVFALFGLPSVLVSDNRPQFVSEQMTTFLQRLGIRHIRSSPRYPRSNGMVERLHRLVKERMVALKPHLPFRRRLNQVLFDVRHSRHRMLGTSPNEALFSRPLRSRVPTMIPPRIVNPSIQLRAKATMARDHDARRGVKALPHLQAGKRVILHDGYNDPAKPWTVVEQYGRQVGVTDGVRILLRNRQHVRELVSPAAASSDWPEFVASVPKSPLSTPPVSVPVPTSPAAPQSATGSEPLVPASTEAEAPLTRSALADASPACSSPRPVSPSDVCRDQTSSPASESPKRFHDGMKTRSGRQVTLTEKARAAYG
ncbi:uncharacterized protein LOC135828389 [Sycon ciliatum]|uniref:uncharacterized protein LOC135828389 n=1 Tax=Sycon ciliatum TaxID=27933 RepID=UPI0031F70D5E